MQCLKHSLLQLFVQGKKDLKNGWKLLQFVLFRNIKVATNNFRDVDALTKSEQTMIDFLNVCK